ncbi:transcriptional activator of glycolytic enzymes-domain-containing protein [Trichophaea hybrida]|nr:transcriptional activator of glycolytic enzymes-domain-containing protein [Trichophaea hybrida]
MGTVGMKQPNGVGGGLGGGGNGGGVPKYPTTNGAYIGAGGQKAATKVGQKQPPQQSYRSPPVAHANITSGNIIGLGGGGGGGGMSSASSITLVDTPREEEVLPSLRVREEGGTETFAVPLCNSWESLIPALQTTFQKNGDPKVMNSRGDTIARAMLPHFLKDGMLFLVSFPHHNPHTGSLGATRSIQQPTAATSNPDPLPVGLPNGNNPPTPYSPPVAMATPPLYQNTNPVNNPGRSTARNNTSPTSSSASPGREEAPFYRLSRSIKSVAELWQEWEKGLGANPSVVSLESQYGPKWRSSTAERKFYSRRKVIIEEVKKMMKQGRTEWDAVSAIEEWRQGKSLDSLSKEIVKRKKAEEKDNNERQGVGQQRQRQQQQQQQQQAMNSW